MKKAEAKEIIDCLPRGNTPFWYFRDRYALLLVSMLGDPISKRDIKSSPHAQLLDKAVVKSVLRDFPGKPVPRDAFHLAVRGTPICYSLTLDIWGSDHSQWMQTTRRGFSLVLQLNFPREHNRIYRSLIDPEGKLPSYFDNHPVALARNITIAWSRMDVDLDNAEVLIEEIQSDWMRCWASARQRVKRVGSTLWVGDIVVRKEDAIRYCDIELSQHTHWPEIMLSASIWFIRNELGIRRVFYHTHESGAALKRTGFSKPPRSLYTQLPAKFCFRVTDDRPAFMQGRIRTNCSKKVVAASKFQLLEL
ncbi:MAG: hypothetical protein AAF578_10070 [Pseudomonadota bacterium]